MTCEIKRNAGDGIRPLIIRDETECEGGGADVGADKGSRLGSFGGYGAVCRMTESWMVVLDELSCGGCELWR